MSNLNLPWEVHDLTGDWALKVAGQAIFPWGVGDCWGCIIGRFDTEAQAQAVVDAMNSVTTENGAAGA